MNLILKNQLENHILAEYIEDWKGIAIDFIKAAQNDFDWYMVHVYEDYKKLHVNRTDGKLYTETCTDELCSWCNYHAHLRDICVNLKEGLDSTPYERCRNTTCELCLSGTTWYKKL